jgi:hypothetical protein
LGGGIVTRFESNHAHPRIGRALAVVVTGTLATGCCLAAAPASARAAVNAQLKASAAVGASGPVKASAAVGVDTRLPVDTGALVQAYLSARQLPAGSVAGIRPGSLHAASVSGVNWAIAEFTPSAHASQQVQAEFQDGGSTAIFSQRPPGSWQLARTGPYGCGDGLPAGLSQAWQLPAPVICQTAISAQRSAASAARSQAGPAYTIGQSIALVALNQVGVGDAPAATSFSGLDCDPYSTLVGALSPNADGCGYDTGLSAEDENEAWCADFAKWVWQQAGVTTDTSALNAGAGSFYDWGRDQGEKLTLDGGTPAVGDAVVFFPPGSISLPAYGDHVGIVTGVNSDGTVNLVDGDFLGTSNISVQYNTKVSLTKWAAQIWGAGEQWVFVSPPSGTQRSAPVASISGSHAAVTGTTASFSATGTVPGGSVTQYQWTFGDGRTTNQAGSQVSHVYGGSGIYPVTMTATSSLGTVVTHSWNVDVVDGSSTTVSTPSDAVWYSTTPISQFLFLPSASGGLAVESSDGSGWLQQAIPGQAAAGGKLTALAYPDPAVGDAMTPHAYFRSSGGTLAQTYLGRTGWTTQNLPGQPASASALAATTAGNLASSGSAPAVFYFNAAGELSESAEPGATWTTSTLTSGPHTATPGSLALATTVLSSAQVSESSGATAGVQLFYLSSSGALTVAADGGHGWSVSTLSSRYGVAAGTPLSALSIGSGQVSVFFVDKQGKIADATGAGQSWTVSELPGTSASTALAATGDLLASGSPGRDVFWLTHDGQPAVTAWNGQQWKTTTLPGTATSISGVNVYPGAGQSAELFLADGATLRLDASSTPGSWTAATLPNSPATLADRVLLYAATPADDASASAAASAAGLPASAVTESFRAAWAATLSGNYLVIAVGSAALDALYYNQCGWGNPSGDSAGGTPFSIAAAPLNHRPALGYYENAAAATTSQTPALAASLAWYALYGALPAGVKKLPAAAVPEHVCAGKS